MYGNVKAILFGTSTQFEISEAGRDELPFLGAWGGWLSLIAFAIIAYSLITVPLGRKAPAGDTK